MKISLSRSSPRACFQFPVYTASSQSFENPGRSERCYVPCIFGKIETHADATLSALMIDLVGLEIIN